MIFNLIVELPSDIDETLPLKLGVDFDKVLWSYAHCRAAILRSPRRLVFRIECPEGPDLEYICAELISFLAKYGIEAELVELQSFGHRSGWAVHPIIGPAAPST